MPAIKDTSDASSSKDSTIQGNQHPTIKTINDPNENTSLFNHEQSHQLSALAYIKSFLMYQPRPVPYINKTLPSNNITIGVLALVFLNILYTFYRIPFTVAELAVLAERSGLVFVTNLPLLYLLSAKNQPLKVLTGCSYESLNIFHRRLGEILCLQALLHASTMFGVWYTILRRFGFSLAKFVSTYVVYIGLGAFVSYELIYLTSLHSFRRKFYELFLGLHIILQTGALGFLFLHQESLRSRICVLSALAIFLVDRLVYRLGIKRETIKALTTVLKDGETVRLSMTIPRRPRKPFRNFLGHSILDGWEATDHIFITIPSLGYKHSFQAHPFTIFSPVSPPASDTMSLTLLIRSMDGFSLDLLKKAKHLGQCASQELNLRIDGPYGSSHARTMLEASDLAVLVAGGSGIAVIWPLVHHLLNIEASMDSEFIPMKMPRRQKIVLIWVVHREEHKAWVSNQALEEIVKMGVKVISPGATEVFGRPDLGDILTDSVEEFGVEKGNGGRAARVVVSGPDSMNRVVRNTCSGLVKKGKDIDVVVEKFGW